MLEHAVTPTSSAEASAVAAAAPVAAPMTLIGSVDMLLGQIQAECLAEAGKAPPREALDHAQMAALIKRQRALLDGLHRCLGELARQLQEGVGMARLGTLEDANRLLDQAGEAL